MVGSVQSNPDLAAALTELTSKRASLRALRYRYSEQYPLVQRLVGDIATLERQTIPALARGLIDQLKAREADLDRRIGTDSRSLRQIPARAIEEARLRRTVTMTEGLYTMLQQRFEEARLAEASTIPDVRVLDAAVGWRAPLLVTITSPGAGDGKSFLAANLAHTFADGGHRTLLIDADIRRGVLHRRLNARRRPGLSDFLRGESPLDAIVQATPYPSLSLIGCGTRAYNAPEMLGSPAMAELVNGMRSGYDVILFDSPPLAAGVDPLILSTLTGTLALVLRTGYSHREVAAAKLEMLQRLPVRLLGAILNDVPAGGARPFVFSYVPCCLNPEEG